jgi:nicotinamide mononucleotide transporter
MSLSDAGAAALAVALRPAFTAFGSPITWLELVAVVLALWMVGCNLRVRPLAWPLAIASSALYGLLFWDARLYGDAALQLVFIAVACWGWWQWLRGTDDQGRPLHVNRLPPAVLVRALAAALLAWPLLGAFLDLFTDTDVPYWDAFPTTLSLLGQWLLGRKHIENWPTWIAVNTVSVGLFAYKGLWLTVVLYAVFVGLSVAGWRAWQRRLSPGPT